MQFERPITIADALQRVEAGEYIIPVIQRDFVWKTKQIERLFDSLLREYPIGSFLFWEVSRDILGRYPFFEFSEDITESDAEEREALLGGFAGGPA